MTAKAPLTTRWSSRDPSDQFSVENPATGAIIAHVQGSGQHEVDAAIGQAAAAQRTWAARPARERGEWLLKVALHLRAHADEIAALETAEMGKPLGQARFMDVEACIGSFTYFGALVDKLPHNVVDLGSLMSVERLEPYGVIAGIIPFNWPPIHFGGKVAPALAVGNAIVLKPGEQAPLTVMRLAELVSEILPDDVVHVLAGGPAIGAALVGHRGIGKVTFTGAPTTGARVLESIAANLTPALMELGGKNAMIVFDDADLSVALADAVEGAFLNQGEACTAASRILVHRTIYDRFAARLAVYVGRLKVGDGSDPSTHVGPLVDARQQRRVEEYIAIGVQEGARIIAQAQLPDEERLANGNFVAPTLFADVHPDMRIAQEEIFGPVTCLIPFDDENEAITIANGTEFGLVAAVYSADAARTQRVARALQAGVVFINNYNRIFMGTPFGGIKASGYGREHCVHTLGEFGWLKAVRTPTGVGVLQRWAALNSVVEA